MPPSLALGFQHPVCDSDVGCGATSFVSLAGCQGCCWEIGVAVVPGGSWKSGKGVSFPSNSSSVVSVCLADE